MNGKLLALAAVVTFAAAPLVPAQSGERSDDDLAKRTQALIDRFIGVMPHEPLALREASQRAELAPKALPVLREVREFVAANPTCALAPRVHEFTVFALVLGESDLRDRLAARAAAGDQGAKLLLGAADTIVAEAAEPRATAVAAVAKSLRAEPSEAACAIQCVAIAADLSVDEAKKLAASTPNEELKRRLDELADAAARDPRRKLGQPFEVAGKLLDGTEFSTRSLRGKVVLVDFWATWCGPCVRSLPELARLHREHGQDLAILGVDCDDTPEPVRKFLAEHPEVDWPHLFAAGKWHPIATALGVQSIPRVFLIDRNGILRSVDAGKDLDALVRRYLAP